MIIKTEDIFPVLSINSNLFFTKNGDITLAYQLYSPEIFSLGETNIDDIHSDFNKFVAMLPQHTILHKQDVYLKKEFSGYMLPENSFLEKSTRRYFEGRKYLEHNSFLYITLSNLKSLNATYDISNFLNQRKDHKTDRQNVLNFTKEISSAISTLNSSQYLKTKPIAEDTLKELFLLYFNGFEMGSLVDIEFKPNFKIGSNYFNILALNNEENQGETISNSKVDLTKTTDRYTFYKFFTQSFGLDVNCNHIVNQILYIDDHLLHKSNLEKNIRDFNTYSDFSTGNKEGHKTLTNYMTEIVNDEKVKLCRGHFNVIYWTNQKHELASLDENFISKFRELDIFPYRGTYEDYIYFYLGCFPGNAGLIPREETFLTDIKQCSCYFNFVSNYKTDPKGIVFNERLFNIPVIVDIWDEPYRTKQVDSRNFAILAGTGGGKSYLENHIFRQLIEQDYSVVLADVGKSTEIISKLYKDKVAYIAYKEGQALGINPFKINYLEELTSYKTKNLSEFVFIHWKKANAPDENERVSMNKIIGEFYRDCPDRHAFPTFYNYIKKERNLLDKLEIRPEYFNTDEFLHVCSEYVSGIYDFLYEDGDYNDLLQGKQSVFFELSEALTNPDILSLMFLQIQDTADTKVWKEDAVRKILAYEEAAKLMKFDNVLRAIDYGAQTIRKYQGALGLVLQTIDNIPKNEVGTAIINNIHNFFVFEPKKGIESLKERLNLSPHDVNQLLSVRSNLTGEHRYTEFAHILGSKTRCLRLETSKECYYSYLSEFEDKIPIFNELEKGNTIEQAILNLIKL
jgi:conjugal transfer ATP-binding protein TraC